MSLPVKKIYIDTEMKTFDSYSNSNFKWELPETVSLPHNCIFLLVLHYFKKHIANYLYIYIECLG